MRCWRARSGACWASERLVWSSESWCWTAGRTVPEAEQDHEAVLHHLPPWMGETQSGVLENKAVNKNKKKVYVNMKLLVEKSHAVKKENCIERSKVLLHVSTGSCSSWEKDIPSPGGRHPLTPHCLKTGQSRYFNSKKKYRRSYQGSHTFYSMHCHDFSHLG